MTVAESRSLLHGRRLAEEIAAFAGVALADESAGRREAGELDVPLICRWREGRVAPPRADRPTRPAAVYAEEEGRFTASVPRPSFSGGPWARCLLVGLVLACVGHRFDHPRPVAPVIPIVLEHDSGAPPPPSLWPWRLSALRWHVVQSAWWVGTLGAPLAALALAGAFFLRRPARRLEASPAGVAVSWRYLFLGRRRFIPTAELEELRVDGGKRNWAVTAVSDRRLLRFGRGLPRNEVDYICSQVWGALGDPPSPRIRGPASAG
jgi:hypothetical protein